METEWKSGHENVPMRLLLAGFFLMFAGIVVLLASALFGGEADVSGGAIIFVGPVPIILGAGPDAFLAIILAAVLTVIGFIVFFWMRKQFPRC